MGRVFNGIVWALLLPAVLIAQEPDPYRAPLFPIQSTPVPAQLSVQRISGPLSLPPQDNTDGEALPQPRPQAIGRAAGTPGVGTPSEATVPQDEGIVQMLKPLVVEPQNRETLTQRYPGGQVMIEREVALDVHGNYMNDGSWKMFDLEQRLIGVGRFEQGQMVGLWRRVHLETDHPWLSSADFQGFVAPFVSSAEFVDGKLSGVWVIKDRQERKLVELSYRAGRRQGPGTWWHTNGQMRRQVNFQDDLLHGGWREWNAEGQVQNENWFVEGQRIDKQINYFAAERPESELSFLEAKLTLAGQDDWWNSRLATYQPTGERIQTGPVKAWYDNGQRHLAGYYKDGQPHGDFAWWHPNGNRKLICTYEAGQRVGKWIWWHENGIKAAEGSYQKDRPIGAWMAWNEIGEITGQRDWDKERESLARPDYDAGAGAESATGDELNLESMEELPPTLSEEPLQTPVAPSFDLLDLPPPANSNPPTESTPPTQSPPAETTPPSETTTPPSETTTPPTETTPAPGETTTPPIEAPPVKPVEGVTGDGETSSDDRPPPPRPTGDPTIT